jgi:putative DNA methylase
VAWAYVGARRNEGEKSVAYTLGGREMKEPPRLLIEEWLPAAAIGVECMRERGSASALAPTTYLHVWWARRPLTIARAAVLGSLLPRDFSREMFESLLGFGKSGNDLVNRRSLMDTGYRVPGGFDCERAFKHGLRSDYLTIAHSSAQNLWGSAIAVIDPMAGGGSIPLESARLGFRTLASEYNPVACSVLEATVDYPLRFGRDLGRKSREWAAIWEKRVDARLAKFYPARELKRVHAYVFARTVPCPDTGNDTPLVPDWYLLKPKSGRRVVAVPVVDKKAGIWKVDIKEIGTRPGQVKDAAHPTYADGKGISLFTGYQIPIDYIKAKAQAGEMRSVLYAVAVKSNKGLDFLPPTAEDLKAMQDAEKKLSELRPNWERDGIIPTERIPEGDQPGGRLIIAGIKSWADMFTPRQLLCFGVLVEELNRLRPEITKMDGHAVGEAIIHLLALTIDKFANHDSVLSRFESTREVIKGVFGRHGYEFHATHAEMAPCNSGAGLAWATDNVLDAYEKISELPHSEWSQPVEISLGSASSLPQIEDGSMTAVVVDPPYADNVQYAELSDFFYVWLKRTQGHRRPEWFSTYLCERDKEAVVNLSRHRENGATASGKGKRNSDTREAKKKAIAFYQKLMAETFVECKRILRDDGALTVMFTHKKQEAWESLFSSLIDAGFRITATWPVKTESEHSLHQAKKNAAQSTVILVARKRSGAADVGYFDAAMSKEIQVKARESAERLQKDGLNPVDQLVGSFGPAMEVYSRFDSVRTDTGSPVGVGRALEAAADAVSEWRVEKLAEHGLDGVEPEGRFALLCWDVLGAAEFRFNEAKLLGHAVRMDVDQLIAAGLVTKSGDKIHILSAKDRRRERALEPDEVDETLFGPVAVQRKHTRKEVLKVHPNDPGFRTALDACHALALRYDEAASPGAGIGSARALIRQQRWSKDSAVAKLMEALVHAAPEALRHDKGKKSAAAEFPEFRAWHALLDPLFGIAPPDWTEKPPPQGVLALKDDGLEENDDDEEGES